MAQRDPDENLFIWLASIFSVAVTPRSEAKACDELAPTEQTYPD
jgi:hypothetical protein